MADILTAGPSRCFPFWQEVLACYVVNTNSDDDSGKRKCVPVLEDYYECLHHKKEVSCDPWSSYNVSDN
jgi:NADH dehydrogenase (ubiquinone) Fe-S protein 5